MNGIHEVTGSIPVGSTKFPGTRDNTIIGSSQMAADRPPQDHEVLTDLREAWRLLKIRRALLTSPWLCLAMPGTPNSEMRVPQIQSATASLLYVNAVALLSEGVDTRPPPLPSNLGSRLKVLRDRSDLLDYDALARVAKRRNEIAHELGREATVAELDSACVSIQGQLSAWELVTDDPPYTLQMERGAMRASTDPSWHYEHDRIVRVMNGDSWVCEWKTVVRFGGSDR